MTNEVNTSINIIDQNGNNIPLNERIKAVAPVAAQPSILNQITQKLGNGFYTGTVMKKLKRKIAVLGANNTPGSVGGFTLTTSQQVHTSFIGKIYRGESIVYSEIDLKKLNEAKNGNLIAQEVGDFIITAQELDLNELLNDAKTKANAIKLHTSFDANSKPTGVQPVQTASTFAGAITAIQGGKRVVQVGDFNEKINTRIELLRETIQYFNEMGTARSTEKDYLFSINGHSLDNIVILGRYRDIVQIKDTDTSNFINVNGSVQRNITGMVGFIDNDIKLFQTNQIPAKTVFVVMTNRVFVRDVDTSTQYIGKVRDTNLALIDDGNTGIVKQLRPSEKIMQFEIGIALGVYFPEEIFFLDEGTIA